jgi:hypothetical protein
VAVPADAAVVSPLPGDTISVSKAGEGLEAGVFEW